MRNIFWLLLLFSFSSCCLKNFESEKIISPSKKYYICASVNRENKNQKNYADVVIHLYKNDKREIDVVNSNAGDFSKWALGWTIFGDTIVLQSSDISNKAWVIKEDKLNEISMTDALNKRAEELYRDKYK